MPFDEAEKFLEAKRLPLDTITTLEECRLIPQFFYGQAAAEIRASQRYNMVRSGKEHSNSSSNKT